MVIKLFGIFDKAKQCMVSVSMHRTVESAIRQFDQGLKEVDEPIKKDFYLYEIGDLEDSLESGINSTNVTLIKQGGIMKAEA